MHKQAVGAAVRAAVRAAVCIYDAEFATAASGSKFVSCLVKILRANTTTNVINLHASGRVSMRACKRT